MKSTIFVTLLTFACAYAAIIGVRDEGPSCPIDDPLTIEPGNMNISIPPLFVLNVGSVQGGGVAIGLKTLFTNTTFALLTTTLDFVVRLSTADATGISYSATGEIQAGPISPEIIPSGSFTGSGSYHGAVKGFTVAGQAVFLVNLINNRITIRVLRVDELAFDELHLDLSSLVIGDVNMDWAVWNAGIKENFAKDWATKKLEIIEYVRVSANEELKKYTIAELIEFLEPKPCPTEAPKF